LSETSVQAPGVYFGFYETPAAVFAKADALGVPIRDKVKRGVVEVVWQPPTEAILDAVGARLIDTVKRTNARRVFIDSLGAFSGISFHPERALPFFAAIANELRAAGATTLWTYEVPHLMGPELPSPLQGIAPMVDNAIAMRFVELDAQLIRVMSVMKKRNGSFDPSVRQFTIDAKGLAIGGRLGGAEALMTGNARHASGAGSAPRRKGSPRKPRRKRR
jgi:circadian clock protein KaiC